MSLFTDIMLTYQPVWQTIALHAHGGSTFREIGGAAIEDWADQQRRQGYVVVIDWCGDQYFEEDYEDGKPLKVRLRFTDKNLATICKLTFAGML